VDGDVARMSRNVARMSRNVARMSRNVARMSRNVALAFKHGVDASADQRRMYTVFIVRCSGIAAFGTGRRIRGKVVEVRLEGRPNDVPARATPAPGQCQYYNAVRDSDPQV
jgi:hypothetical protein